MRMNEYDPFFGNKAKTEDHLPAPIAYSDFSAKPVEKPKTIIENLLESGSRMVFGGGSKTYKTWAMVDCAISISTQLDWWGFSCHPYPVLYVNFELKDYYARERFNAVRKAKGSEPKNLWIWNLRDYSIAGANLIEFQNRLLKFILDNGIVAVFLDPFYKLLGELDERVTKELMPILLLFEEIARATGAAIVTAAHFTKGNQAEKEPIDRISGGGGINRHPDALVMLTSHKTEGSFTVDVITRDFAPLEPFVITWTYPILCLDDQLDPTDLKRRPGGSEKKFSPEDFLELLKPKDDQFNTTELQKYIMAEMGCSRGTFFDLKAQLEKDGKIFRSIQSEKWNLK